MNHGRKVSIVGCNHSYSVLKSKETHPEIAPPKILEVLLIKGIWKPCAEMLAFSVSAFDK